MERDLVSTSEQVKHESAEKVLQARGVLKDGESIPELHERVAKAIFPEGEDIKKGIEYLNNADIFPGLPIYMNIGTKKPLASCAVVGTFTPGTTSPYYQNNIGCGVTLSETEIDPGNEARRINAFLEKLANSGRKRPPSANVLYPFRGIGLETFIRADRTEYSKISRSVILDEALIEALNSGGANEREKRLFHIIAEEMYKHGQPGVIFLDRMNRDNPILQYPYISSPPCAETGLPEGGTCYFLYINLANCVRGENIDYEKLRELSYFSMRALDNIVDQSIPLLPSSLTKEVAQQTRKSSIGVTGGADMLIKLGIPFASKEGRQIMHDVLSTITYTALDTSVSMVEQGERIPCLAMIGPCNANRAKFAQIIRDKFVRTPSLSISGQMWSNLEERVREGGVTNPTVTALPPGGSIAYLSGTNQQISPIYSIFKDVYGERDSREVQDVIRNFILSRYPSKAQAILAQARRECSFQNITTVDTQSRNVLRTISEISPEQQVDMALAVLRGVTDSLSLTVTLPSGSFVDDVEKTLLYGCTNGLKGITIYVAATYQEEPKIYN
jgi:ribonucleotide reductase alpha subunit